MATKFKKIEEDLPAPGDPVKVLKWTDEHTNIAKSFSFTAVKEVNAHNYSEVKNKMGSLAVTDGVKVDNSFALNQVMKEALGVSQEEMRAIDDLVQTKLDLLKVEAVEGAKKEGYQKGFETGTEEGLKQFKEKALGQFEQLKKFADTLETAKKNFLDTNEKFFIALVYKISKMVLLKDLSTDTEYLKRIFNEVVDKVGLKENITLKIATKDAALAEQLKIELVSKNPEFKDINLVVDPSIELGGCILESRFSEIDARVEHQLKEIEMALLGQTAAPSSQTPPTSDSTPPVLPVTPSEKTG